MSDFEHESEAPRLALRDNTWAHMVIKEWMKSRNVRFDVGSNSYFMGKDNITMGDLAMEARVDIRYGKRKLSKESSLSTVRAVAKEGRKQALETVVERLVVPARTDDSALRGWLKEVLIEDMAEEEFENCVVVMKQWMWLVQKALLGRAQQWHIMPIFWGGQGGGKSTQVSKLLAPLGDFWAKNTFQVFMGQFDALPMHWNYALFLDEMGSASKAEAARVKMCIDSPIIPGRGMFTDEGRRLVRNASFIAATNEPPPHGLMDTTGGRRFYSLECRSTPVIGERAAFFNGIDYKTLWWCVDPNAPAPVLERREQIAIKQHVTNRAPGSIERFLDEGCEIVASCDTSLTEFRDAFREHCLRSGMHFAFPPQRQVVSLLESLGLRVVNLSGRYTIKDLVVR